MKKILLSVIALSACISVSAQCTDLIISEYVEGTGNNKALELYNTSSSPISLANYRILRYDNGNTIITAVEGEMQLPSNITVAPYTTYVIALNLTDPNGTGQTAPIAADLQAAADTLLCPGCASGQGQSRVMCFNGDDALALEKNVGGTWTKIDIFGCIGERPLTSSGGTGAGWTAIAPFWMMPTNYDVNASGPYYKQYWSQDKTLKRKATVTQGVSVNPAFETFNPSVQWDSLQENTFSGLGAHVCDCSTANSIKEMGNSFSFSIYPNPSSASVKIQSAAKISKAVFYNVVGQGMKTVVSANNLSGTAIDISGLAKGIYTIVVFDDKNNKSINKLIIE